MPQGGFYLDTFYDTGADEVKASMNGDRSGYIHFIESSNGGDHLVRGHLPGAVPHRD